MKRSIFIFGLLIAAILFAPVCEIPLAFAPEQENTCEACSELATALPEANNVTAIQTLLDHAICLLRTLLTIIRDSLYLVAYLGMELLRMSWEQLPLRFRPLLGIVIAFVPFAIAWMSLTLHAAQRFLQRLLR